MKDRKRYIHAYVRTLVRKRDKNQCVYCGYKYNKRKAWLRRLFRRQWRKLEWGHVYPFSKGGSNCSQNVQLECFNHNRQKGSETVYLSWFKRWVRKEAQGCWYSTCTHDGIRK